MNIDWNYGKNNIGDDKCKKGMVYFVGAGPYDPELITLKGVKALKKADVVVYDYLANPRLLQYVDEDAQRIYVGKKAGNHAMKQDDINQLLVDKAKQGHIVVRLKGGDPYVFGRGGEEAEKLLENDISFEVISGISSAISVPAHAGIPVTYRNVSRSFHVMTGRDILGYRKWNWEALCRLEGTLIFLMGIGNLKLIMENLLIAGKESSTPVAIIMWGSSPKQRTLIGTVENIYERAIKRDIKPPGIIVVGDVVSKRQNLHIFENRVLHGKKILVTRARTQKSEFCDMLMSLGADVIELPTIKIDSMGVDRWQVQERQMQEVADDADDKMAFLEKYNWIVITSANGVHSFMNGIIKSGYDARLFFNKKFACVGAQTANVLREYGIVCDVVPPRAISDSLVETMKSYIGEDDNILVVRGDLAPHTIKRYFESVCGVDELTVYNTLIDESSASMLADAISQGIDAMAFTSGSTARNLAKLLDDVNMTFPDVPCFSMGEKTSAVLKQYTQNIYEADEISIKGLVDKICEKLGRRQND